MNRTQRLQELEQAPKAVLLSVLAPDGSAPEDVLELLESDAEYAEAFEAAAQRLAAIDSDVKRALDEERAALDVWMEGDLDLRFEHAERELEAEALEPAAPRLMIGAVPLAVSQRLVDALVGIEPTLRAVIGRTAEAAQSSWETLKRAIRADEYTAVAPLATYGASGRIDAWCLSKGSDPSEVVFRVRNVRAIGSALKGDIDVFETRFDGYGLLLQVHDSARKIAPSLAYGKLAATAAAHGSSGGRTSRGRFECTLGLDLGDVPVPLDTEHLRAYIVEPGMIDAVRQKMDGR